MNLNEEDQLWLKHYSNTLSEEEHFKLKKINESVKNLSQFEWYFTPDMIKKSGEWAKQADGGEQTYKRHSILNNGIILDMTFSTNISGDPPQVIGHYECFCSIRGQKVSSYLNEGFEIDAELLPYEREYAADSTVIDPSIEADDHYIDQYNITLQDFMQGDISIEIEDMGRRLGLNKSQQIVFHKDIAEYFLIKNF